MVDILNINLGLISYSFHSKSALFYTGSDSTMPHNNNLVSTGTCSKQMGHV